MTDALLATYALQLDAPGDALIDAALAARGVDAGWAVWDDTAVDWAAADLVLVRSTWDYHRRWPEFRDWTLRVDAATRLVNSAATIARNADKRYLLDLAADVPTVPTALVDDAGLLPGLRAGLDRWGTVVVKPRVGASGVGVVVASALDDLRLAGLTTGPWILQPLVESVRTEGESSLFVFAGRAVAQFEKRPAGGEIRVHHEYGGSTVPVPLDERAALAEAAVAAEAERLDAAPAYARVDLMEWDGVWSVSELELIEPGLYLDVEAANAERFADLVVSLLAD